MKVLIALALAGTVLLTPTHRAETVPTNELFTIGDYAAGQVIEWTVPEGVTEVRTTAAGGNGGTSGTRPGGQGATVAFTVPVTAGQVLAIVLGDDGLADGTGGAGYASGGTGIKSAGGGGSTAILLDGEPIVVAAGGGGAGAQTRDGGGGNGGLPAGSPGARNAGLGGANAEGGVGKPPWGGPGGAGFAGSGGDVGSDSGAGGGAGWGGGGAGGSVGDGGGGGSYPATLDPTAYGLRGDIPGGGAVTLDYDAVVAEAPAPAAPIVVEPQKLFGIDSTLIGIGAAVLVGGGVLLVVANGLVKANGLAKANGRAKDRRGAKRE